MSLTSISSIFLGKGEETIYFSPRRCLFQSVCFAWAAASVKRFIGRRTKRKQNIMASRYPIMSEIPFKYSIPGCINMGYECYQKTKKGIVMESGSEDSLPADGSSTAHDSEYSINITAVHTASRKRKQSFLPPVLLLHYENRCNKRSNRCNGSYLNQ